MRGDFKLKSEGRKPRPLAGDALRRKLATHCPSGHLRTPKNFLKGTRTCKTCAYRNAKLWSNKHPEKRKQYEQKRKSYKREWNINNAVSLRKSRSEWKKRNKEDVARTARERRAVIRENAFNLYGGKCNRCGFTDWRALQMDHVKGFASREKNTPRGARLYSKILLGKVPKEDYQLLCANCNWIKRVENGEYPGANR